MEGSQSSVVNAFWSPEKSNEIFLVQKRKGLSRIQQWNLQTQERISCIKTKRQVLRAELTHDSHMLLSYEKLDQQMQLVNLQNKKAYDLPNEHQNLVFKMVSNFKRTHFISTCYENSIKYWEIKSPIRPSKAKEANQ